jgi:hypothetical protein
MSVEIGLIGFDCDDFDGRIVTGASSGGGSSSLCFSFQCLFKLFLHLYKLPHNEQANFTRERRNRGEIFCLVMISIPELASSGSGTRRYRAGSTETL